MKRMFLLVHPLIPPPAGDIASTETPFLVKDKSGQQIHPSKRVDTERADTAGADHIHLIRYIYPVKIFCLLISLFFAQESTFAQTDSLQSPPVEMNRARDSVVTDTIKPDKELWQPDPKKALWYSLALPGLGQIYNRSWWKTPIIYGGLGVSIWFIIDNNQNYKDFRTAYSESFDPDSDNELVQKYPNQESLRRIRDIYYKRYQLSIIATAAIYLMNGVEAYVDAHLKNFEISDDLSLRYGEAGGDRNYYGSYSLSPRVFPVIGITYKLD